MDKKCWSCRFNRWDVENAEWVCSNEDSENYTYPTFPDEGCDDHRIKSSMRRKQNYEIA